MSYRTLAPLLTRALVAARTDVGLRRMHNEDDYLVADCATKARFSATPFAGAVEGDAGVALAVVDGMGGHSSGDRATKIAVDVFHSALTTALPEGEQGPEQRLVTTMSGASRAIVSAIERDRTMAGMGAAAVLASLAGDLLHVVHAGDSRAYLLRAGRLVQLTRDDSLINDALAGRFDPPLTAEQIAELPANVLTKALGMRESVDVKAETFPLRAGDVVLLCSDGLHCEVPDEHIERVLNEIVDPAEACSALVNLANKAGGRDNITVVVARPEGTFLRPPGPDDVIESRNPPLRRPRAS